jgi:hypothetical protein
MNPYNLDIFGGVESPPQKIKKTPNRKIPPERIWENKYYLPGISAALSAHYNLLTTDD